MSTNLNQSKGFFTSKDIEVVKEQWENKIKEIKIWREYALKRREKSKLEKYDSYKDSGVEWLGEIPSEWEVKKLKFLN